jgi:hypothetical protein
MNWDRIRKNVGWHVRLVPMACRLDQYGRPLPDRDDDWYIQGVEGDMMRIAHAGGISTVLAKDHIHHFTSDPARSSKDAPKGFLTLNVQLFIRGADAWIRPTLRPGEALPPPSRPTEEMLVGIDYCQVSGLQARLEAQGYVLVWSHASKAHQRMVAGGFERVVEENTQGHLVQFRVKDRIEDLVLLKRLRPQ